MCYAHIINLSSGNVVSADGEGEDASEHAIGAVRAIRSSGKRREAFDEMVRLGNSKGWFKVGNPPKIVLLKELQLLRNVPTRWDSIFLMLNRLREMRAV